MNSNAQAIKHLRDAARYAGYDGVQLMRIAERQTDLGAYADARRTLIKATRSAQIELAEPALIRLEIRTGEYAAARARIDTLAARPNTGQLARQLDAELLLEQGETAHAIARLREAVRDTPSTEGVLGLSDALMAAGDLESAAGALEGWLDAHPDDDLVERKLAMLYLPLQRLDAAERLHAKLLENSPDDPVLLANLARIHQINGDTRARALAERALAAAPEAATTLDTLGWILVTEGEVERGLALLREAITRQDNPLIRFHVAQALAELGRTQEARAELRRIIQAGQPPALVADVQRYYDGLPASP
jgi:tetratricopeptide (TPR) repeat protein